MSGNNTDDTFLAFSLTDEVFERIGLSAGHDLLIIPHTGDERSDLIQKMALLEAFVEQSGNEEVIKHFQTVGALVARSMLMPNSRLHVLMCDGEQWFMGQRGEFDA